MLRELTAKQRESIQPVVDFYCNHSACVGIEGEDGTVTYTDVKSSGYLSYTGVNLTKHYKTDTWVRRLLRKGTILKVDHDFDYIESLGTSMKRVPLEEYCDPKILGPGEVRSWYLFRKGQWYFKCSVDRKPLEVQLWKLVTRSLDRNNMKKRK